MKMEFELSSMFTDHMVLQQKAQVPIWGKGLDGGKVTVQFQGQTVVAHIQNGSWVLYLEPLQPGGPYEMKVRMQCEAMERLDGTTQDEMEEIVLHDVLIGEVWFAGGQSNMVQQLIFTEGGMAAAESANHSNIRFFTTPRRPYSDARVPGWSFLGTVSDSTQWQICTPENALHFSGIGYYFAELLQEARQLPIGIISCNWGGTPIQAWMSEEYLERDPELKPILNRFEQFVAALNLEQYEIEEADYHRKMYKMIEERGCIEQRVKELGLEGYRRWIVENPLHWPPQPWGPKAPERPCGLYHAMLKTVIPYSIRGILWYQGESNAGSEEAFLYRKMLTGLIGNWRQEWGNPELPFLIVQLPSYAPVHDPHGQNWAVVRESQAVVACLVPQTALIVTIDCGERQDIHPIYKRPISERLALAARAVAYGEAAAYQVPRYESMSIEGSRILLSFDQALEGWELGDVHLSGFDICEVDRLFIQAEARVVDDRIEVFNPKASSPVAVRYAWRNMPEYSLRAKNGLPVSPFRTDDFEIQLEVAE